MIRIDEHLKKTIVEEQQLTDAQEQFCLGSLEIDKSDFTDKAWTETYAAAKSGVETIEIYLDDLKEETKTYIINELLGGSIENYDIMPITILYSEAVLAMEDDSIGVRTNEGINFLEEYTENSEIPQWFIDAVEELDWSCTDTGRDVELENWSPAGEDLIIYAEKSDLVGSLFDNYQYFDKGEHVKTLLDAKANGFRGVPDIDILVEDADDILQMYKELADKVAEAARNAETSIDECKTTVTEEMIYDGPDVDEYEILRRYVDVEIPDICNELIEILGSHEYNFGAVKRMLTDVRKAYDKLSNVYQEALEGQL